MTYQAENSTTNLSQRERLSTRSRRHHLIMRSSKALLLAFIISLSTALFTFGQDIQPGKTRPPRTPSHSADATLTDSQRVEQALGVLCAERSNDPLASVPIDEMQARPSLELNHPEAVIGAQRARRLLPVAKDLVIQTLRQMGAEFKIDAARIRAATTRVQEVTEIAPDPDLRDNAAVIMSDPHTIRFGTIFLVGLPSDEGMLSVLSHELTHIADGKQNSLQPLFQLLGKRASNQTGIRINGQKPEELTCDLVGVRAGRYLISITPNAEPLVRRLARLLEHNCVDDDETDDEHLSPRNTMRAVLALDPALTRELSAGEAQATKPASVRLQMP